MKVHLNQQSVDLILTCLKQQASEFTEEEMKNYQQILHSIEIAQESINYDF
jgi:hypothetical protein